MLSLCCKRNGESKLRLLSLTVRRKPTWARGTERSDWRKTLTSQLAYALHSFLKTYSYVSTTCDRERVTKTHKFPLVLLIRSSNSFLFRPRYSWSSSKSSTRCLGARNALSCRSCASRRSCSAVIYGRVHTRMRYSRWKYDDRNEESKESWARIYASSKVKKNEPG